MALQPADPHRIQMGMAYLAHAARSDEVMVAAAADELGSWQEAAFTFAACTRELLAQLSLNLNMSDEQLATYIAVKAAEIQANQGAAT